MTPSKNDYFNMACIAEKANRFDDMVHYIRLAAATTPMSESFTRFTQDERNILSVAYKDIISPKRAAWRRIYALELKHNECKRDDELSPLLTSVRHEMEMELKEICDDVLALIANRLLANDAPVEDRVYYLKMTADYNRYLAEFACGDDRKESVEASLKYYNLAIDIAIKSHISAVNPTFLGLYLNYSVFYYEIIGDMKKALELSQKAFDDAAKVLDDLLERDYRETTQILQLLRDNISLWSASS